jgi:hypothetical protein
MPVGYEHEDKSSNSWVSLKSMDEYCRPLPEIINIHALFTADSGARF